MALTTGLFAPLLWMMPLTTGFIIIPSASFSPSRLDRMPLSSSLTMGMARSDAVKDALQSSLSTISASSLASDYAINIHSPKSNADNGDKCGELKWELYPLSNWEEPDQGEGTLALRALIDASNQLEGDAIDAVYTLSCQWQCLQSDSSHDSSSPIIWSIDVAAKEKDEVIPRELMCVLGRIMVQSAASQIANINNDQTDALLHITLPLREGEGCQKISLSDIFSTDADHPNSADGVRRLFDPLNSQYAKMEIVDMVNHDGSVLGSLPRPYVHTWNILHRGIGMMVSRDDDIFEAFQSGKVPEVYVHQRTSTKRIFPSLYDMFVGGVSCSGEDDQLTAAREVAEELGLKRALNILLESKEEEEEQTQQQQITNPLSEKLFQCTVCTSYNRCVVSMFTYTCDTKLESITWQEEEVAWGDYVPYDIVEVAGDMSIDRLVTKGTWPGGDISRYSSSSTRENKSNNSEQQKIDLASKYENEREWESWDFVPDGLLVWEAWESFISQKK